jgi:hypothetical protein
MEIIESGFSILMFAELTSACSHNNQISVVIEPGPSLVHAGMRTALAELDSLQDLAILGLDGCRLTIPFD